MKDETRVFASQGNGLVLFIRTTKDDPDVKDFKDITDEIQGNRWNGIKVKV